jgi:hypothetical protein
MLDALSSKAGSDESVTAVAYTSAPPQLEPRVEDRDAGGSFLALFTFDDCVTSGEVTVLSDPSIPVIRPSR